VAKKTAEVVADEILKKVEPLAAVFVVALDVTAA
jgi:hypothetical protein